MAAKPTTVPLWAYGMGASITVPMGAKMALGWIVGEPPPAQYFNWQWNLVGAWCDYVNDLQNHDIDWQILQHFDWGIVVAQQTVNGWGVQAVGNGTGYGVWASGGLNGVGVHGQGRGAATAGVEGYGDTSGGAGGPGLLGVAGTGGAGGVLNGNGAGAGLVSTGGASGIGVIAQGGTGAAGARATGGNNAPGLVGAGAGTGAGATLTGGASGVGAVIVGGTTGATITAGGTSSGAIISNNSAANAALVVNNAGVGASISADSDINSAVNINAGGYLSTADASETGTTQPTPNIPLGRIGISGYCPGYCKASGASATLQRGKNVKAVTGGTAAGTTGSYKVEFNFTFADNFGVSIWLTANQSFRVLNGSGGTSAGGLFEINITARDLTGTLADCDFTCGVIGE